MPHAAAACKSLNHCRGSTPNAQTNATFNPPSKCCAGGGGTCCSSVSSSGAMEASAGACPGGGRLRLAQPCARGGVGWGGGWGGGWGEQQPVTCMGAAVWKTVPPSSAEHTFGAGAMVNRCTGPDRGGAHAPAQTRTDKPCKLHPPLAQRHRAQGSRAGHPKRPAAQTRQTRLRPVRLDSAGQLDRVA